jgi:hypothetical protein
MHSRIWSILWSQPRKLINAPGSILEGVGIIHDVLLRHDNFEVALNFHVFDVYDFDALIGHPFEKLFLDAPILGTFNVKLGKETFSIPISPVEFLLRLRK